jgi:hypothetical protein
MNDTENIETNGRLVELVRKVLRNPPYEAVVGLPKAPERREAWFWKLSDAEAWINQQTGGTQNPVLFNGHQQEYWLTRFFGEFNERFERLLPLAKTLPYHLEKPMDEIEKEMETRLTDWRIDHMPINEAWLVIPERTVVRIYELNLSFSASLGFHQRWKMFEADRSGIEYGEFEVRLYEKRGDERYGSALPKKPEE